jgi:hypothetical protein
MRLILLLTVSTLLLGSFAAAPLGPALRDQIAERLAGDHLVRNDAELAPADAFDFLHDEAAAVHGAFQAAWWGALLGLLLQIFFVGGIVSTLGRRPPPSRAEFWAASRRDFAHNLKCFLLFLVASAILVGLWVAVMFGAGHALFRKSPPHTTGAAAWIWISVLGALLLFGVLTLLYDFARATRRRDPRIGALAGFAEARRRLRGRWVKGLGLLAFWLAAGVAAVAIPLAAAWGQRTPTGGAVFVNLLLIVLAVTARSAVRVGAWGSLLALFDASEPPPPPAPSRPSRPSVDAVPVPIRVAEEAPAPPLVEPPPLEPPPAVPPVDPSEPS